MLDEFTGRSVSAANTAGGVRGRGPVPSPIPSSFEVSSIAGGNAAIILVFSLKSMAKAAFGSQQNSRNGFPVPAWFFPRAVRLPIGWTETKYAGGQATKNPVNCPPPVARNIPDKFSKS